MKTADITMRVRFLYRTDMSERGTRGIKRARNPLFLFLLLLCVLCSVSPLNLHAETGYDMWLRYAALDDSSARQYRGLIPDSVIALTDTQLEQSARAELIRGIDGMLGRTLRIETEI